MAVEAPEKTANVQEEEQELPDEDRLKQAAASAQKALEAQSTAKSLKNAASSVTDPKKREKLLRDAYDKEVEAHGNSKKARILSSGAFQGATGGAGIGGVVGVGVGTVVGTLVGGLTAIPTTALGGIVGSGVGAIHGPFIKLGDSGSEKKGDNKKNKQENKENEPGDGKETHQGDEDDVVPDPDALRQVADAVAEARAKQGQTESQNNTTEKKKPRKLEIRSKQPAQSDD